MKIIHHVCNVHTWMATNIDKTEGHCDHPIPLQPDENQKPWLEIDSPAHRALIKEVFDRNLLNNLSYIKNFRYQFKNTNQGSVFLNYYGIIVSGSSINFPNILN